MNAVLTPYDPLISEFQTAKQERAYTAWVNAKVEKWDSPNITDTQLSSRSVFQTLQGSIH